jgi:hypothetical protein
MLLSTGDMMAGFIEESTNEINPDEVYVEAAADPAELESVAEQQAAPEEDVPEKYRGKSAKEIAQMHMEAEKLIGRQGSEVGELRRIVDDYIRAQAASKPQLQQASIEEEDFFADPKGSVEKAVESHPAIQQARQLNIEMTRQRALAALQASHPDYQEVVSDPGFKTWVEGSRVRQELLVRADRQFDYEAANELLSLYKERKSTVSQTVEAEKQARKQAVRAATTTSSSGSDEAPSKKIYRRADIIKLMQTDPDKYDMMQNEIMAAYREGRVK